MKNIAIIPARSGSKGLKDKNIKLLNGKPLLAYSIEAAKESGLFEEITVSTDSVKYAKIAEEWGANVPFLRPAELSNDTASSWDAVKYVIEKYRELGREFDTVALLQPTSPLRNSTDIIKGYEIMEKKSANSVIAVCEAEHSPLWMNTLPKNHSMAGFIRPDIANIPRQSIPTYYRINGALYIVKVEYLINCQNIYSDKSYALIMDKENSIDIDDIFDFKIASLILKERMQ
ncbi:acylneuraminate cytidylyltransferase family protein [Acetivibrio straminisolvens]|uniref:Legionaminic acid cytidylyltransferase n=1 Tax=Acetivibrio straminisolvens JCM 21531 TaxID=1294263 RepID=W4V3C1_9FIRM|nr:acylneuraminate cytidylyltransferase family protein [Acetivibrio straminisolvens]GAE87229.1 legionaminic acid cytidylyltransferase [Acetivibrio straminisolvens JCM 21531]